jgi:hypothetical protein
MDILPLRDTRIHLPYLHGEVATTNDRIAELVRAHMIVF